MPLTPAARAYCQSLQTAIEYGRKLRRRLPILELTLQRAAGAGARAWVAGSALGELSPSAGTRDNIRVAEENIDDLAPVGDKSIRSVKRR